MGAGTRRAGYGSAAAVLRERVFRGNDLGGVLPLARELGHRGLRTELQQLAAHDTVADLAASAPATDVAVVLEAFASHRVVPPPLLHTWTHRFHAVTDGAVLAALSRACGSARDALRPLHSILGANDGVQPGDTCVTFVCDNDRIDYIYGCMAAGVTPHAYRMAYAPGGGPALSRGPRSTAFGPDAGNIEEHHTQRALWRLRDASLARLLYCCARAGVGGSFGHVSPNTRDGGRDRERDVSVDGDASNAGTLVDDVLDELLSRGFSNSDAMTVVLAAYSAARVVFSAGTCPDDAAAGAPRRRRVRSMLVLADRAGGGWIAAPNTRMIPFHYATLFTACASADVTPRASLHAVAKVGMSAGGLASWKPQHLLAVVQAAAVAGGTDAVPTPHAVLPLVEEQLRARRDTFPLFVAQHMRACWARADRRRGPPAVLLDIMRTRCEGLPPASAHTVGRTHRRHGRNNPLPDPLAPFERVYNYEPMTPVEY